MSSVPARDASFQGARARFSGAYDVAAPPAVIFPLLCPVREREWIEGWSGQAVHAGTGVAEPDGVFLAGPSSDPPAIYVVSRFEQDRVIEYVVVRTQWVQRLALRLSPSKTGTRLEMERVFTGLDDTGNALVLEMGEPELESRSARLIDQLRRHLPPQVSG
jgi:hypothetical protein